MRCVIIDYGMGNLKALQHKLGRVGISAEITNSPTTIGCADFIILPGVGHFAEGMRNIHNSGILPPLAQRAQIDKVPVLGICLGMQLMCEWSEEGDCRGLGWFNAKVVKFDPLRINGKASFKVPHVGWQPLRFLRPTPLSSGLHDEQLFYFTHSYHVMCDNPADELCKTRHGDDFTSAIQKDNLLGVQFHPEKSRLSGMRIIQNFLAASTSHHTPTHHNPSV